MNGVEGVSDVSKVCGYARWDEELMWERRMAWVG